MVGRPLTFLWLVIFIGAGPAGPLAAQNTALAPAAEARAADSSEFEKRLEEARNILLSAKSGDLTLNYRLQLEKAVVLYYQASLLRPQSPEVWLRLGRLAEIRALWARDHQAADDLMEEARSHFLKAAQLGFEQAHPTAPPAPGPEPEAVDPFVSELLWSGRLRRGEITYEDLYRRYSGNDLSPLYRPGYWTDLRFLIRNLSDPPKKEELLAQAADQFEEAWRVMPVEVPVTGPKPEKLKKINILAAWTDTLLALSADWPEPPADPKDQKASEAQNALPAADSPDLFSRVLALYPLALKLPLDRFEISQLITRLEKAEPMAPEPSLQDALWKIKDDFFTFALKITKNDPSLLADWGRDYYHRADLQADDRRWAGYQAEAARKFTKYTELFPDKAQAHYVWGRVLEFGAYTVSPYLAELSELSQTARYLKTLTEARTQYEKALKLQESLEHLEALARVSLFLAFEAKDKEAFEAEFIKAVRLGHQAVRGADNPPQGWFNWGRDCLNFRQRIIPPPYRGYLTAEAFSSFNRYLNSNSVQLPSLTEMADLVWTVAAEYPEEQDQALSLLIAVCRKLTAIAPQEPGYGFALGLSVYAQLNGRPAWPDDPAVTDDYSAKKAFLEVMYAFLESLEGLSVWQQGSQAPEPLKFMAPEVGRPFLYANRATFQERLASALNRPVVRLLSMARPETLPPWYRFQTASFLRLAAASGYPPEEEQMAYFRLALHYLRLARTEEDNNPFLGLIMAEEGLVLAELNLLNPTPDPILLNEAESLWAEAEKITPGSSHYARARWSAWRGDEENLKKSLSHPVSWEDNLTWPDYRQGVKDPAFRAYINQSWFKKAWFGYSR
ncbi:MAG: hypothetical protein LBP22_08330 [Deltaproteobacteria bacterium]|jgi:hypothetical protein|nr:hypothetical protein [Deltaproteobacteria bacterium]